MDAPHSRISCKSSRIAAWEWHLTFQERGKFAPDLGQCCSLQFLFCRRLLRLFAGNGLLCMCPMVATRM